MAVAFMEILLKLLILIPLITPIEGKIIQEPSSVEMYSETPCEIRSLSAFRDIQGNLWSSGEGNVWWFNATNLSWSVLPLPNTSLSVSNSWRVTCADPKKYVSLQSLNSTLILHLPWQHWQQVEVDDGVGSVNHIGIDPELFWCNSGTLLTTDTLRQKLYALDVDEARWTLFSNVGKANIFNDAIAGVSIAKPWQPVNGLLFLIESSRNCSHILSVNISGGNWTVVKKQEKGEAWPKLTGRLVTWIKENTDLWLWRENEIWFFNATSLQWKNISASKLFLPHLVDVLDVWAKDDDNLCFLIRTEKCVLQYSSSSTKCWVNFTLALDTDSLPSSTTQSQLSIASSTSKVSATPPLKLISSTITSNIVTKSPVLLSIHDVVNKHSLLAALQSELDDQQEEVPSNDVSVTVVPLSKNSNLWHQHTSVFGSVIFFGTSITIFGVVGSFWCVKRCVHFPKEALLLRDPPSVRYTAIPDTIAYDSRGQPTTSSAYAVIPDSIA